MIPSRVVKGGEFVVYLGCQGVLAMFCNDEK